jgi:glycosyltransferase involved in cell wall biosynthesis
MKIVFVCNEYPPRPHGGIGTFVHTVAQGLLQKGHQVTVVGFGESGREEMDEGIRVVTLLESKIRYLGNLISRLRLRRWLTLQAERGQLDIVEVPDYMGVLPFRLRGCAVVIRLHVSSTSISLQAGRKVSAGISRYERRTLAANTNWIGVSNYVLDLTHTTFGLSAKRSAMIYNPVPTVPSHLPEMPELPARFVLYAGQISRRKGALVLAEAARDFIASHPDVHLVYVGGEIPQHGDRPISELIRETVGPELNGRVHILGHLNREKVLACMTRAAVFAFPSCLEALPLVVLEAMKCGVPVVCTTYPPGPEIVEDGVNGLLADPTSPRDFSEKITRLLGDSALAHRLAVNARQTVIERFSLERCLDETERFYEKCLVR